MWRMNENVVLIWVIIALTWCDGEVNGYSFNSYLSNLFGGKTVGSSSSSRGYHDGPKVEVDLPIIPDDADEFVAAWHEQFSNLELDSEQFELLKKQYEESLMANGEEKEELNGHSKMTMGEGNVTMAGNGMGAFGDNSSGFGNDYALSHNFDEMSAALAVEAEKLARKFGLSSMEELKIALDALDGIGKEDISSSSDGETEDTISAAQEERVRTAYMQWCKVNKKEASERRFPAFMTNYLQTEAYAHSNGKLLELSEYADCTEEEYDRIRKVYLAWCELHEKRVDESRFYIFLSNYVNMEEYGVGHGEEIEVNEYADLTEEEYAKMVSFPDPKADDVAETRDEAETRINSVYLDWCEIYGKEPSEARFSIFVTNYLEMERFVAENDMDMELTEYADVTAQEFSDVQFAYLNWCKLFEKTVDEKRFPVFFSNYQYMLEYSKASGKEMKLNKYADCTEHEYILLSKAEPSPKPTPPPPTATDPKKVIS